MEPNKNKINEEYITNPFENPRLWGKRLSDGLVKLEKIVSEVVEERKKINERIEKIEEKSFGKSELVQDIIQDVKEATKKLAGKVGFDVLIDYMKSEEGKQKVKEEINAHYQEILKDQVKEVIEGKKGVVRALKKFVGLTTTGVGLLVLLSIVIGVIYVANRTTAGNIVKYQKKIEAVEKKWTTEYKKYDDKLASIKKSIDDALLYQGKVEDIWKQMRDTEYKKYDDQFASIKKSIDDALLYQENTYEQLKLKLDAYENEISEIKKSLESYSKLFDEMKIEMKEN